jgi:hypothetical protein
MRRLLLIALVAAALPVAAASEQPPAGTTGPEAKIITEFDGLPEARIPFADNRGIQSFRTNRQERDVLYIEGRTDRWFRATFRGSCPDLRFANSIGVRADPTGTLDRFGAIIVNGDRCLIRSLVEVPGEPTGTLGVRVVQEGEAAPPAAEGSPAAAPEGAPRQPATAS